MKHISILITICALVFAQMAHAANEVTEVEQDGITYGLYDDNTAIMLFILEPQNIIGDIVLPGTITHDGTDYTLIEVGGFRFCTNLTGVTIPNSVSTIGNSAFYGCSSLASVTIPNSVSTIGDGAFSDCSSLTSVTIPSSVSTIGKKTFRYCSKLNSVTIPNSVSTIGIGAFEWCSSLTSITIPNSVSTIEDNTFYECKSLTSVTIPNSVSTIGNHAFNACQSLQSVTIGAFVQSIGEGAFTRCGTLTEMTFYPSTPPVLGNSAISNSQDITIISSNRDVYHNKYRNSVSFNPESFVSFGDSVQFGFGYSDKCIEYFNAVIEAITHAANRAPLSDEDNAALEGYMTNMTTVLQEFHKLPSVNKFKESKPIFDANEISAHKVIALAGIRQALPSDGLLEEEQTVVNAKIASVNSATSLADIYTPQKEAIDYMALHPQKISALAAIEEALQGNTNSKYLNDLVKEQVTTIKNATDAGTITNKEQEAVNKLQSEIGKYTAIKDEAFGTLGTKQNGPALIVTDKDGNEVILYSPKSVEYIKVNEE